ncbi:APC family permease [Actinocrispum wychmicini]|uniref:Amino acid transporter n=1 Tax=Actinocrispum wychmicini TaxID=1213861 RepID=A0A4R2JYX9_9PSEU|nr:APC family permease [Actinocrispum wychmicini]TCO65823.1 amino acid transporter [Actinocrispum wychmicini]
MAPLRRTLSVWQAIGLSVALMAPSMAANINPQFIVPFVGRAVPLAFLLAAVAVLLVAYGFVRLCQYFNHAGSVYAFVGATLGPRTGVVAGVGLLGTYTFYAVGTAAAAGRFGTAFLQSIGVWPHPPSWAPFLLAVVALLIGLQLTVVPAKRGMGLLLLVEGVTVALILLVTVIVLVRLVPSKFDLDVFTVPAGTGSSAVFLGVVFGFLSFAGFEAAATLGEETAHPRRDIPRAILGTAIFGGVFFVVVTAVEMMGFGDPNAFANSQALVGELGTSYVGSWVGDTITLGAAVSAFGCMLACVAGGSRLLFALARDSFGARGLGAASAAGTPARAAAVVSTIVFVCLVGCWVLFGATATDLVGWFGAMGTLILLVAYLLTTVGAIRLLFVRRVMDVPRWQVVIPLAAIVVLGYTLYSNVIPYPTEGAAQWFPIVAGGWLLLALVAVWAAPATARRVGERLADVRATVPD